MRVSSSTRQSDGFREGARVRGKRRLDGIRSGRRHKGTAGTHSSHVCVRSGEGLWRCQFDGVAREELEK